MSRLDEAALRRPEFTDGVPIVLCDGVAWHFHQPVLRGLAPLQAADGSFKLVQMFDVGDDYEGLLEEYISATQGDEELIVLSRLAWMLLAPNYDLSFNDLRKILWRIRPGDPGHEESQAAYMAISNLALGLDSPKLTPSGSGSAA